MTVTELKEIATIWFATPEAIQLTIEQKSSMQVELVEQSTTQESWDVLANEFNQGLYNKLIKIGQCRVNMIGCTDLNKYCIAMAVGTILKELFEDNTFATAEKLLEIYDLL